jgi:cation diffusion facilitator CzcD-associated flavoprotein CzcO
MRGTDCDVAIVGAGPYGLAAAAHLHAANGLDIRVLGEPMSFWERQMPVGMALRSPYVASHIADPKHELTLDSYQSDNRLELRRPVGLEHFVDYGRWFQRQAFPELDTRSVTEIESNNGSGFRLDLADGSTLRPARVVVAAGIMPFAWKPQQFRDLPAELASHSSEHRDLSRFAGKRVVVVGGGQSALESAALLHEAGADVQVLVRAGRIYFLRRVPVLHSLGPLTSFLFAPAEVGPAGISRVVSAPSWYRRLPRRLQTRWSVRSLRPAGAAWLEDRLAEVPITLERSVVSAREHDGAAELTLDDGSVRTCDHVLLATGYKIDISGYPFLGRKLLGRIDRAGGFPKLTTGFESSVRGLYFMGAPSAWSYGPLMRFVAGTDFAAPVLTRAILGSHKSNHTG